MWTLFWIFYLSGLVIAIILEVLSISINLLEFRTIRYRNMRRLEWHFNFALGIYEQYKNENISITISLIVRVLVNVLLSWISIISVAIQIILKVFKHFNTPKEVKEFNFKLKNFEYSKKELIELEKDLNSWLGVNNGEHINMATDTEYSSDRSEKETLIEEELIEKAIQIVKKSKKGSTSLIQRKLGLGYARAYKVLSILEEKGIIDKQSGEVL